MRKSDLVPWRQSERKAADIYGEIVPYSGAVRELGKSDIVGKGSYYGLRGENKWTDKGSYSLKLSSLQKIQREAFQCGSQDWFFRIDFNGIPFILVTESTFRSWHE